MRYFLAIVLAVLVGGCDRGPDAAAAYRAKFDPVMAAVLKARADLRTGTSAEQFRTDLAAAEAIAKQFAASATPAEKARQSFKSVDEAIDLLGGYDSARKSGERLGRADNDAGYKEAMASAEKFLAMADADIDAAQSGLAANK